MLIRLTNAKGSPIAFILASQIVWFRATDGGTRLDLADGSHIDVAENLTAVRHVVIEAHRGIEQTLKRA